MAWIHGKFVWFEHMSAEPAAARKFYDSLFGWRSTAIDMGAAGVYPMIFNGSEAIGGFRTAPPGVPPHWTCYLSVDDVDARCAAAVEAGATVLLPPTDYAPVGRGATIADPQGAVLTLWKSALGDRPDVTPTPAGDWSWCELMTRDADAAVAFYTGVVGYTHMSKDMGAIGAYHLLQSGGRMRAGVMRSPRPEMPPFWLPYVLVADCEASAATAAGLGAQVIVAPMAIEAVGSIAVFGDPFGAAIGVVRWLD